MKRHKSKRKDILNTFIMFTIVLNTLGTKPSLIRNKTRRRYVNGNAGRVENSLRFKAASEVPELTSQVLAFRGKQALFSDFHNKATFRALINRLIQQSMPIAAITENSAFK